MVRFVNNLEEFDKTLKESGDKLVVVDFTASWCGPCQQIGPKFEGLSQDPANKNVVFLKVDVDEGSDVAEKYGIQAMPTFVFFKNGVKVDDLCGANENKLKEKVKSLRT